MSKTLCAPRWRWIVPAAAALLGSGLVATLAPAQAATDYLELRERLEVARPALQSALQPFRRSAGVQAFAADKPGEAFGRYLDAAWKAVDAQRAFPEVHAALGRGRGKAASEDAAQRQAYAVLLADYMQARYGDDIQRELATLVGFKTFDNVVDRNPDNAAVRAAFDALSSLATRLGLQVHNDAYRTLRVTLPATRDRSAAPIAVWSHIDVPRPVDHKWTSPPWTLTDRDGRWFGLGVYGGKGPVIVNLFVMRALRDAGLPLARPLVLVISSQGEQFAGDVGADLATLVPKPAVALSAAGEFPYATGELGHLLARVASTRGMKTRPGIKPGEFFVHKIETIPNVSSVPMETRVWVRYEPPLNSNNPSSVMVNDKWRPTLVNYQRDHSTSIYETYVQADTLHFFAYGQPRHVQRADQAANPIYDAAGALLAMPLYRKSSAADILLWIDGALRRDPTGKALGLAHRDAEMGGSWVVPIGFDRLGDEVAVWVDVRWPAGRDAAWVRQQFAAALDKFNAAQGTALKLTWEPGGHEPERLAPPPEVRRALDEAFVLASGESMPAAAVTAAGARTLPAAIPFGPEWPRGEMRAHVRDESISPREMQDLGVAYLAALSHLATVATLPPAP
jgi:acetylornithine deacetylase/succinyl-diaminopimelate desuccinylase-like protein